MALSAGTTLGPYEILSPLGEGGMGVVYRARDTRLGRDVAIKMLPSEFERDPSRRSRFEQEARALGALNHPNILAVYDVGENYLVTELVDGDSLIGVKYPLRKSLEVAAQVAEGLSAAHATGITHRDLKPGNIMMTKDGRIKILDFGLARQDGPPTKDDEQTVKARTVPGTLIGTIGYMSPEQVRALPTGPPSDIFSLGVVLHELIGGERPFHGASAAETMAAIVNKDATALPVGTPGAVVRLVDRCLAKEPGQRWQSARDLAAQLRWLSVEGSGTTSPVAAAPVKGHRNWQRIANGVLAVAFLGVSAVAVLKFRESPPELAVQRFEIASPAKAGGVGGSSVSPDGRWIVFPATSENGVPMLWSRRVDAGAATPIPGTEGALAAPDWAPSGLLAPIWSPDSRFVAFALRDQVKKIAISGGTAETILKGTYLPSSWNRDNAILATTRAAGIVRFSASGGAAATVLAGSTNLWSPAWLPDGKHFLYADIGTRKGSKSGVFLGSLDGEPRKELLAVDFTYGLVSLRYLPKLRDRNSGYVVYRTSDGVLAAHAFDLKSLQLAGATMPLLENVSHFDVSETGLLAYTSGSVLGRMAWVDRSGKRIEWIGEPGMWAAPRLSPDGKRVAVAKLEQGNWDIWIVDLARKVPSRFTFGKAEDNYPLWSPDGAMLVYSSTGGLHQKRSAGKEVETLLLEAPGTLASCFSPDGKLLFYEEKNHTFALPLAGDRKPYPVLVTEAKERESQLSPDGKWLAYSSTESGSQQVYVQSFPPTGAKWQISTLFGGQPEWRRDGKELFFLSGTGIAAVDIRAGATLETGTPKEVVKARLRGGRISYQANADGTRFLVTLAADDRPDAPFHVVVNWEGLLKKN